MGKEKKRGGGGGQGVQALAPSPKSGFSFVSTPLLQNMGGQFEGERERRIKGRGGKLLLIRCPVLSVASRHQEHHPQRHEVGALEGREKKNTVSVQETFPIDYASRQRGLKGSHITQPKLEGIQADICPSDK